MLQKLLSHSSESPPEPKQFRPDLPDEVAAILNRLLAKLPSERYEDPRALIGELLLVVEKLGLGGARGAKVWVDSRRNPAWWAQITPWLAPLVALAVLTAGLEFYWSFSAPGADPPAFRHSAASGASNLIGERPFTAAPVEEPAGSNGSTGGGDDRTSDEPPDAPLPAAGRPPATSPDGMNDPGAAEDSSPAIAGAGEVDDREGRC